MHLMRQRKKRFSSNWVKVTYPESHFPAGPAVFQNEPEVTAFAKEIREKYPAKTIWLYTGYLWEELQGKEILRYLDVLVDGRFVAEKKDIALKWKGSSNQRVIDVQRSLEEGNVVLHAD